jgi:uncharacterized membrane protein
VDTYVTAILIVTVIDLGLSAGLFATFSYAVMTGLRRTDDRTFVSAMQQINIGIINPWFALIFVGSLVLTIVSAILHVGAAGRPALPWILAGLAAYLAVLVITFTVNVPLNNRLAAEGDPAATEAARQRFEPAWVRWNAVRTLGSVAAFACLVIALVVHARV